MRTGYPTLSLCCIVIVSQVGAFSTLHPAKVNCRLAPTAGRFRTSLSTPDSSWQLKSMCNDDMHHDSRQIANKTGKPIVSKASGVVLASVCAATLLALPQCSSAINFAGGATDLAASTFSLWDNLAQTGFYQAFSLVFLSEIGDKTFFIAGLLAMKTSRFVSYLGSMGALAVMTVLSVLIGQIFHAAPPGLAQGVPLDDLAAVLAFAFFGFKTLKDALDMDNESSTMDEEFAEAEETVEESSAVKLSTAWAQVASIFGLVFAAEFGDRSFLSTIALSAAQNPFSVAGGAIAAHGLATGIAVGGGSFVAKYISERVIGLISGTLFLVFALTTALGIF